MPLRWLVWLLLVLNAGVLSAREWADASGAFRIEAELVEERDGKVVLRKADGKTVEVPLAKLSAADRAFVRGAQIETQPAATTESTGFGQRASDGKGLSIGIQSHAELEQMANKQPSVQAVLTLYKLFLSDSQVPEKEKQAARERLAHWEQLAKQGAKRIGRQWVTSERIELLKRDEDQLIADAWRIAELGNHKLAEEKFLAASKLNPDGIRANFILGLYQALTVRKASAAEHHFLECVKRRQSTAASLDNEEKANLIAALNNLALAEIRQRKYDTAIKHWKAATSHAPPPPEMIQNIGRLVHLSEGTRNLGITKSAAKSATKLYGELAAHGNVQRFDPNTGWLYIQMFSPLKSRGNSPGATSAATAPVDDSRAGGGPIVVGTASGFVIEPKLILTNYHVVENADKVLVSDKPNINARYSAKVLGVDRGADLALLECPQVQAAPLKVTAQTPRLATDIIVLGYPESMVLGNTLKATRGSIVGLPNPQLNNQLLYDAVTNPGNSGGPVCDQFGRVVAIHALGMGAALFQSVNAGKLGAGIPAERIAAFMRRHRPDFQPSTAEASAPLDWSDVAEQGGSSTVYLQVLMRPIQLKVARTVDKNEPAGEAKWKAFEDPWCMLCNGRGTVDCPVRNCSRGMVPVERAQVVGVNPANGQRLVETGTVHVPCQTCKGRGHVDCTQCSGGIDPTVRGGRAVLGTSARAGQSN